jgi:hypothetical protein
MNRRQRRSVARRPRGCRSDSGDGLDGGWRGDAGGAQGEAGGGPWGGAEAEAGALLLDFGLGERIEIGKDRRPRSGLAETGDAVVEGAFEETQLSQLGLSDRFDGLDTTSGGLTGNARTSANHRTYSVFLTLALSINGRTHSTKEEDPIENNTPTSINVNSRQFAELGEFQITSENPSVVTKQNSLPYPVFITLEVFDATLTLSKEYDAGILCSLPLKPYKSGNLRTVKSIFKPIDD